MGYLMSERKAPEEDDLSYATWDAENSVVMIWLVNSMEGTLALITCVIQLHKSFGRMLIKCILISRINLRFSN